MGKSLDSIKLLRRSDDTFMVIAFSDGSRQPGETDDLLIARLYAKYKLTNPRYKDYDELDTTMTEINQVIKNNISKGHIERLKITKQGALYIDETIKTSKEKLDEIQLIIKEKLKTGQALTDQEADFMLGLGKL